MNNLSLGEKLTEEIEENHSYQAKYDWEMFNIDEKVVIEKAKLFETSILNSKILLYYNIHTKLEMEKFLLPNLRNHFPDPFLLSDVKKAVQEIINAIKDKKKFVIIGDYDVDGISSSALLYLFLKNLYADVEVILPNRFEDGYGLSKSIIKKIPDTDILITVDCGSSSLEEIEILNSKKIKTIIIDHHLIDEIPNAYAVINPHRADCSSVASDSNYKNFSASGLTLLFIVAMKKEMSSFDLPQKEEISLLDYLSLSIFGLIADVMHISGDTRLMVKKGLQYLPLCKFPGIKCLLEINGLTNDQISISDIGFKIAPQINAAGRLAHPKIAFDALVCDNLVEAKKLVNNLYYLNEERKLADQKACKEAIKKITNNNLFQKKIIITGDENWSKGIIGIIAAKVKEKYNLPTIIFSYEGGEAIGSARSVNNVNIGKIIKEAVSKKIAINGGGHSAAAGLTLKREKIEEFDKFCQENIEENFAKEKIEIISNISLNQIDKVFFDFLDKCLPFGRGIENPLFLVENLHIDFFTILKEKHASFSLCDANGKKIRAIYFNTPKELCHDLMKNSERKVNIVGNIEKNNFKGKNESQILIKDLIFVE